MERKHWMDNLRWVTVLLVLFYHVIYFYNNKGVFGGIGGFGDYPEYPQYQDIVMYLLYPFFMPLLFLLAGIGSRYALDKQSAGKWFKARTRKLLVPSTIGLFVFHWMVGYFNTAVAVKDGSLSFPEITLPDSIPVYTKHFLENIIDLAIKHNIYSVSGTGPLWFIQVLWLLCLVLLLVRVIDRKDRFYHWCGKANYAVIILLGVLFWAGEQTLIKNPRPESLDGLYNLYKPIFYLVPFLMGYFVFAHDEAQEKLGKAWIPLIAAAVAAGTALVVTTFGQDNTSPQYLGSWLNCLYGWLMCLAMMAWFKAKFNRTGAFAGYMTKNSYGLYILHYLVIGSFGYMMKQYTSLAPWMMYVILTVAVMTISPLLNEIIKRIPFIRWCVLGIKKSKERRQK